MDIRQLFPTLGAGASTSDGKSPSATKKGPGRKAAHGHKKIKRKGPKRYVKKVATKVGQSQTDNVTNKPLKAATRGS
jgi:hypothetical protein